MQRKATATTRGPNAQEKHFHNWIKTSAQHCASCGNPLYGCILHHCMGATYRNQKVLIGHWFSIPLCQRCDDIVTRGSRKAFRLEYGPQCEMWNKTIRHYTDETSKEPPIEVYQAIMSSRQ